MSADFERRVEFRPGYNYLHETGPSRRGQHGMEIAFVLVGPEGATQFVFFTGWTPLGQVDLGRPTRHSEPVHIDHYVTDRYGTFGTVRPPTGSDLGFHWASPVWEGQEEYARDNCQYLPGRTCYYDGSGLRADEVLRKFIAGGEDPVWVALREEYDYRASEAAELAGATR